MNLIRKWAASKRNRDRLLALAKRLDRWALRLRAFAREATPKRQRKSKQTDMLERERAA